MHVYYMHSVEDQTNLLLNIECWNKNVGRGGEKKPNKLCFDDLELSTLGLKNIEKPETIFEKIYKTA